jgi:hypothetical protein
MRAKEWPNFISGIESNFLKYPNFENHSLKNPIFSFGHPKIKN